MHKVFETIISLFVVISVVSFLTCDKDFSPIIAKYHNDLQILPHKDVVAYTKLVSLDPFIFDIWIAGPELPAQKLLDDGHRPVFSHDGKKVAFYRFEKVHNEWQDNLYYKDSVIGFVRKCATIRSSPNDNANPNYDVKWSHDDTKLAYSSVIADSLDIFIYNLITNTERRLTKTGFSISPKWSNDDKRIANRIVIDNEVEIAIVDVEDSNNQIIDLPGRVGTPIWLSDGRIVVESKSYEAPGYYDIYMIDNLLSYSRITHYFNLFLSGIYDENNLTVYSVFTLDSLEFKIMNLDNFDKIPWFKIKQFIKAKMSSDKKWMAYMPLDYEHDFASLYIKNLETNADIFIDDNVIEWAISWSN